MISASELLLSDILHEHYRLFPNSLSEDKPFTLAQLRELQTLDAIVDCAIDDKVDDLLRKSFEEQLRVLRRDFKLDLTPIEPYELELIEIHARRNAIVHAGSKVDKTYLARVKNSTAILGDELQTDEQYIARALDVAEVTYTLITAIAWKKWRNNDQGRAETISQRGFEALQQERWTVAEVLGRFASEDDGSSETVRLNATLNFWQSKKWQGRFADVEAQVRNADFSAVDIRYQLARYALLNDEVRVFDLLPTVIVQQRLSQVELRQWPIFREMRNCDRFESELSRAEELLSGVSGTIAKINASRRLEELPSAPRALDAATVLPGSDQAPQPSPESVKNDARPVEPTVDYSKSSGNEPSPLVSK